MTILLAEGQLVQVKTLINFGCTLKQPNAGKTLLAKTLAKVLDVPFSVSDATSFTQVSGKFSLSCQLMLK